MKKNYTPGGLRNLIFILLITAAFLFARPLWSYDDLDLPEAEQAETQPLREVEPQPSPTLDTSETQVTPETQETPETAPIPPKKSFWKEKFRYSGFLRQETAYRLPSPNNFSKIKQLAVVDLKFLFNDTVHMKIGGRAWYDAVYDLTDQYPTDVENQMREEVALRDAYLDFFLPKLNIRLGHQQIVWGEAIAQFFADVVNPRDLREFILPTFDYIRLPIWAIDLRYFFLPNATWEIVASPDQTVDKLALPGADFSFFPAVGSFFIPAPPPGVGVVLLPADQPDTNFTTWNAGTRITYLVGGWDLSWLFYTSLDHQPALFKTLSFDANTGQTNILINQQFRRVYHYGFTFSKGVKSSIVRGEFVLTQGRYFNTDNLQNQGVAQRPAISYVLGFDTTLGGKVDMISEFQQRVILGDVSDISDPTLSSWIVLRFEYGFLDEKLVPSLVFVAGLQGDFMVRPRLDYNVTNSVTLRWGSDAFFGPLDTLYGEFRDKTRVYMETEWRF